VIFQLFKCRFSLAGENMDKRKIALTLLLTLVLATTTALAGTYTSYIIVAHGHSGDAGEIPSTGKNQQLYAKATLLVPNSWAYIVIKTPQETVSSGRYKVKVTAYVTMYWNVRSAYPGGQGSSLIYLGVRVPGKWSETKLVWDDTPSPGNEITRNGYSKVLTYVSTRTVSSGDKIEAILEWYGLAYGPTSGSDISRVVRFVNGHWTYALLQVHYIEIEYILAD